MPDIASGLKNSGVCVCQLAVLSVHLCFCASMCVGVFEGTRSDLNMYCEQVCMHKNVRLKENSLFLYLGAIFIVLVIILIRYANII